jgi:sulfatase modifying factor 1
MRQTVRICLLGLMLSGAVVFAGEPTGPRTLENLLAAADAEPQAAVVADEASDEKEAEEPPAARKNDPLQQRLDAALAEYNPAIEKAIDQLAKEIDEEFIKATKKGDIELARKCKEAETALREKGSPPTDDFLKHARETASRTIIRAGEKLSAEFEAVAKEFLRAGNLERAEAVLSEKADLLAEMKAWKGSPKKPQIKTGAKATPAGNAPQVVVDFVTVGDAGNPPDSSGYGSVAYEYRIGKYEITAAQYAAFLNAVAKSDPHRLYDIAEQTKTGIFSIRRSGSSGGYQYAAITRAQHSGHLVSPNRPVTSITWFDAARFANWMHNGQGEGSTEHGAYELAGIHDGDVVKRNADARFWIPSENEWYKAAYYDPSKEGQEVYWRYGTRSDEAPELRGPVGEDDRVVFVEGDRAAIADMHATSFSANKANYQMEGHVWNINMTPVGLFVKSHSHYGCYDMSGNVEEWLDDPQPNGRHLARGGSWYHKGRDVSSETNALKAPRYRGCMGFRLASLVDAK